MTVTLSSEADWRTARTNWPLYCFYMIGFLFVGGGFVLLTSGADLRVSQMPGTGSALSQAILAFFYCTSTLLLASHRNAGRIFRRVWPVLLLPAFAFLSAAWSPEPLLSLRRSFAFIGTTLFGLSLGAAYEESDLIGLIARGLALACLVSCLLVVLAPIYGVHQPGDAVGAVHAGLWRGIFGHRNSLGLWAGASVGTTLVFGRYGFENRALRLMALLPAVACLFGARSGAGFVIATLIIVGSPLLILFVKQSAPQRLAFVVMVLSVAVIALLLRDEIAKWSLTALGKDSNLTGRTYLWHYIVQIRENVPRILGGGYYVGFLGLDDEISSILGVKFGSAHNGYLETFVDLGYVGLAICLGALGWLFRRTFRLVNVSSGPPLLAVFPMIIVVVAAIHNLVESTIMLPNNLNVVLLASLASALTNRDRSSAKYDRSS